jgi:thiamine pyrophosphokinase
MSSHHFVKEGQEPALIVGNGQMCSYTLLVSLLEWSPMVVALDGAYHKLAANQINPDIIIGDLDSLQGDPPQGIEVIKDENQETTDLEKAINLLIEKGYKDITIVGCTGNRLDHTINNFMSLGKYNCQLTMYDDFSKTVLLQKSYSKVYKKGDILSLIPLPAANGITTTNLTYPLKNESLDLCGRSGTNNVVLEDGIVTIQYSEGKLSLIEAIDAVQ